MGKVFLALGFLALLPATGFSRVLVLAATQDISIDMGSTAVWFRANATLNDVAGPKTFHFSNNSNPEVVNRGMSILLAANATAKRIQVTIEDICKDNCLVSNISILD